MSSPHSPPSNNTATRAGRAGSPTPAMRGPASVRRRTARPHPKSSQTPSGETTGRASRFRLWLPDGPIVELGRHPFYDISGPVVGDNMCPLQDDAGVSCFHLETESCLRSHFCVYLPLEV